MSKLSSSGATQSALPFILAMAISSAASAAASVPSHLYWFEIDRGIVRADLDGTDSTVAVAHVPHFVNDLAVDRRTNNFYWTDFQGVFRSSFDGENVTELFGFLPDLGAGISIDPVRNHLYFVEPQRSIIYRSDFDGLNVIEFVPSDGITSSTNRIYFLGLDPIAEKLYWNFEKSFRRSNLDGSEQETLFTVSDYITDFQIDPLARKLYWAAYPLSIDGGRIFRANFDGSQQELLVSHQQAIYGFSLDPIAQRMYFSDSRIGGPSYDSTIVMANLDGTNLQTIINLGPSSVRWPNALTLDALFVPEPNLATIAVSAVVLISGSRSRRM